MYLVESKVKIAAFHVDFVSLQQKSILKVGSKLSYLQNVSSRQNTIF